MKYLGKILALLAVAALAFAGLASSPAMALADDANGVGKVALAGEQEKAKGEENSAKTTATEESETIHEEMKKEMEESDEESEEDEN